MFVVASPAADLCGVIGVPAFLAKAVPPLGVIILMVHLFQLFPPVVDVVSPSTLQDFQIVKILIQVFEALELLVLLPVLDVKLMPHILTLLIKGLPLDPGLSVRHLADVGNFRMQVQSPAVIVNSKRGVVQT